MGIMIQTKFYQIILSLFASIFILLCSVITAPASQHKSNSSNSNVISLNNEARIECMKAIEQVYWNHRIWPKDNTQPKPPLEAVLPAVVIARKADDVLRMSYALRYYWQQPLTPPQLQEEINRMARSSKQPDMLNELWNSLNRNPYLLAECLARPLLAERLTRNSYAFDLRIHGELKNQINNELIQYHNSHEMQLLSGAYAVTEYALKDSSSGKTREEYNPQNVVLGTNEWDRLINMLLKEFNIEIKGDQHESASMLKSGNEQAVSKRLSTLPLEIISPLQEDNDRFYVIALLRREQNRICVATVNWNKLPFNAWWEKERLQFNAIADQQDKNYTLPPITGFACTLDTWQITELPIDRRRLHTSIWTGTEMIVWGGHSGPTLNTGGRYNPSTDTWQLTSLVDAPSPRRQHTAVWTGTEMIIWGGYCGSGCYLNTGGKYDPSTDSWIATMTTGAPAARYTHTAVWTGSVMIIWGGNNGSNLRSGSRYSPGPTPAEGWNATTEDATTPQIRRLHTAIWSGSLMVVWGGINTIGLNDGGKYDPLNNTWSSTPVSGAPEARYSHTAVWDAAHDEMIVWGGMGNSSGYLNTGARLNISSNVWTATNTAGAPLPRYEHRTVWTGSEMIVWGGYNGSVFFNTGGVYNPSGDSWTATNTANAPDGRYQHTAEWTDDVMIIFGGAIIGSYFNSGGRYDPLTDSWLPTHVPQTPVARDQHSAVWTGTEMILWAGYNGAYLSTGARYVPSIDIWTPTATDVNTPAARSNYTAVWTGTEMIIWGGYNGVPITSGSRYNPASDSWTLMTISNEPAARYLHTAIWTGSEMIVWGGNCGASCYLNSGGKYNPSGDAWTATSTTSVPSAREQHSAIWTGTEMFVFGGYGGSYLNDVSRYSPAPDTWTPMSPPGTPPSPRANHTALWTGTEMITWGGWDGTTYFNTGAILTGTGWVPTSTISAPTGRNAHTATLTSDNIMIIWGGYDGTSVLNTGGLYDPSTNTWSATSIIQTPSARRYHSAVCNGSEMIVWGGNTGTYTNTGGIYCAKSASNAPTEVTPLTITKGAPEFVLITYTTACNATDNVVYWNKITGPMTGISWTDQQCFISNTGSYSLDTGILNPGELMYFVVVANNGTVEGSYGQDSSGAERPEATGLPTCDYPQDLSGSCWGRVFDLQFRLM